MRDVPKVGDVCNRCAGTGVVWDEVFPNEWTICPYMDVRARLICVGGRIEAMTDA